MAQVCTMSCTWAKTQASPPDSLATEVLMDRLSHFNYSPLRDWWHQSWYLQIIWPSCVADTLQSLADLLTCLEMQISLCTYCLITSIVTTFSLDCSLFTDNVIQKVKWHFNYVSSTQMDSSLGKIQEELKFQPPVVLTLEDTDVANGVMNGHTLMHLEPGRWPAALWYWWKWGESVYFKWTFIVQLGRCLGGEWYIKYVGEKHGLILFPGGFYLKTKQNKKQAMTNLDQHIKKQRHYFTDKVWSLTSIQSYGFSSGHVWMWEIILMMWEDHKESWVPKNWCFWTVVLEKTLESPLDSKEIKPVHPQGNQSWIFIGRTDAEAPVLWPPDVKSWLIGKDPDAGKDWRQEEKGTTEDEMVGWHHWLNGHELVDMSKLQELVMDKEAWCALVRGATKSQTDCATELSWRRFSFSLAGSHPCWIVQICTFSLLFSSNSESLSHHCNSETLKISSKKPPLLDGRSGGLWGWEWAGVRARASRPLALGFSVGPRDISLSLWISESLSEEWSVDEHIHSALASVT